MVRSRRRLLSLLAAGAQLATAFNAGSGPFVRPSLLLGASCEFYNVYAQNAHALTQTFLASIAVKMFDARISHMHQHLTAHKG